MSIVAYYARLSSDQLAECRLNPEPLRSASVAHMPGAEVIDVDRSWEPLGWLLSPLKRAELDHNSLVMSEMLAERRATKQTLASRISAIFMRKSSRGKSTAISASLKLVDEVVLDMRLIAIEGRTEHREERLNFGLGAAAIFGNDEVSTLSAALASVSPEGLAEHLDPERMDKIGVFPGHWVEEGQDLMNQYIIPNFVRLQSFYAIASEQKQIVAVWHI